MRAEWGRDERRHDSTCSSRRPADVVQESETSVGRFAPDFIVIWGDDQYENFKEISFQLSVSWLTTTSQRARHGRSPLVACRGPNVWENRMTNFPLSGHRTGAKISPADCWRKGLISPTLQTVHHPLGHAFLNRRVISGL